VETAKVLVTVSYSSVLLRTLGPPEANAHNDRGRVPDSFRMEHMMLQLQRSSKALENFIDQLHDPRSPNFHHWINAQELGVRFGVAQQDLDAISH
jgi:subtilase family serine protease